MHCETDNTYHVVEFGQVELSKIEQYIPSEGVYLDKKTAGEYRHGQPHAFECVLLGRSALSKAIPRLILNEAAPNGKKTVVDYDVWQQAILSALGYHDVGRSYRGKNNKHASRAVNYIHSLDAAGLISHNTRKHKQVLSLALQIIQYHSDPIAIPTKKFPHRDPFPVVFHKVIDIITMHARYNGHDISTSIADLSAAIGKIHIGNESPWKAKHILTEHEIHNLIKISERLHMRAKEIKNANRKSSHYDCFVKAARDLNLLTD